MTRKVLALAAACCAIGVAGPSAASAAKPAQNCPPAFTLISEADAAVLPRALAAIDDGFATAEQVATVLAGFDVNGDDDVCYQLPYGFEVSSRPGGQYFYNFVDNNASVPE
jgi:hypothetical protein